MEEDLKTNPILEGHYCFLKGMNRGDITGSAIPVIILIYLKFLCFGSDPEFPIDAISTECRT